ncbi:MAG TPA: DUF5655 domain-containing protein [Terriglobales bacterium]|nr:DUF5655 domain-containing protein [Terriglobales bacterium]
MPTVEEGLRSQIRNIEAAYGKPIEAWIELIRASGLTKHNEVVAMLKSEHGMTHGAAHRVSLVARQASGGEAPAGALYQGKRAALLPIHERLMAAVRALGDDVELAPKRGYVSLRRRKQFAMIQPAAAHVDLGLILTDVPATARLEPAGSFNALFTHRVRVGAPDDVDDELVAWLREAYGRAG